MATIPVSYNFTTMATTAMTTIEAVEHDSKARDIILKIIYVIIAILGIFGNGLVIYALVKIKSLRSFTNVLVINQSAIDFVSSVMFFTLFVISKPSLPGPEQPKLAMFLCKFWHSEYLLWAFSVSSTVNLVCLTIDRYFAVIHPVKYRNKFTVSRAKWVCFLPWIIGPIHEIPWMMVQQVNWEGNYCEPKWPNRTVQMVFGIIVFINHYLVPLIIMVYVYTSIILRLRRELGPRSPSAPQPPLDSSKRKDRKRSKQSRSHFASVASRSVLKTMVIVSLAYLICWGPNEIVYLYFNCGNDVDFNSFFVTLTIICVLCNMCLNPIIYAFNYKELRHGLIDALSCVTYRIPPLKKMSTRERKNSMFRSENVSNNGSLRFTSQSEANRN